MKIQKTRKNDQRGNIFDNELIISDNSLILTLRALESITAKETWTLDCLKRLTFVYFDLDKATDVNNVI